MYFHNNRLYVNYVPKTSSLIYFHAWLYIRNQTSLQNPFIVIRSLILTPLVQFIHTWRQPEIQESILRFGNVHLVLLTKRLLVTIIQMRLCFITLTLIMPNNRESTKFFHGI